MSGTVGGRTIADVVVAMDERLERLRADSGEGRPAQRAFLTTYRRTTLAVADAVADARFEDPEWVERWDVVFADLYLEALDGDLSGSGRVSRPWRLAFDASGLPALRSVLVGMNAHINYDLPQALLAVIDDVDFEDAHLMHRRRRDHERIDAVLAGRVAAEDAELASTSGRTLIDRALAPANHAASRRFLREARRKVWHNTAELQRARVAGPEAYAARLAELEVLSAARVADLLLPGQVVLRLAVAGFGVTLPPAA
ncbi:DUF5995 family protein [Terrabacter sp. NPDC080008]|uniref:DUF5995 family protein n=1 Tax=Terrabacter sp. NPDC080008 TaxID=3155176 RepID=UPI00344F12A2